MAARQQQTLAGSLVCITVNQARPHASCTRHCTQQASIATPCCPSALVLAPVHLPLITRLQAYCSPTAFDACSRITAAYQAPVLRRFVLRAKPVATCYNVKRRSPPIHYCTALLPLPRSLDPHALLLTALRGCRARSAPSPYSCPVWQQSCQQHYSLLPLAAPPRRPLLPLPHCESYRVIATQPSRAPPRSLGCFCCTSANSAATSCSCPPLIVPVYCGSAGSRPAGRGHCCAAARSATMARLFFFMSRNMLRKPLLRLGVSACFRPSISMNPGSTCGA